MFSWSEEPWLGELKRNPLGILWKKSPPKVRLALASDFSRGVQSHQLAELKNNLRTYLPRRRIMKRQLVDGSWPLPPVGQEHLSEDELNTWRFLTQLKYMHQLLDLGATRKQTQVQKGLVRLFRFMSDEGRFPGTVMHQAQACYLLALYGLGENPFARKAFLWMFHQQKRDGGWSNKPEEENSSVWLTALFMLAVGQVPALRRRVGTQRALDFLSQATPTTTVDPLLPNPESWNYLAYGYEGRSILWGGTLRLLEVFRLHEIPWDRRIRKLVDWLRKVQLKNGLWPAVVGKDHQGDPFVTLRVLYVMRHYLSQQLAAALNDEE